MQTGILLVQAALESLGYSPQGASGIRAVSRRPGAGGRITNRTPGGSYRATRKRRAAGDVHQRALPSRRTGHSPGSEGLCHPDTYGPYALSQMYVA